MINHVASKSEVKTKSDNLEIEEKEKIYNKKCIRKIFLKELKKVLILKMFVENASKSENINEMSDEVKINIQFFDGHDYSIWKKRLLVLLKLKKCEEVTKSEKTNGNEAASWKDKDLKAMNYIYSALSNKQLEFVNDDDTSYKIIKKLDSLYIEESTALQIVTRNKLKRLKLKDFDDSSDFFSEFKKLTIELKNAGAKLTEKEKMNYLLRVPSTLTAIFLINLKFGTVF